MHVGSGLLPGVRLSGFCLGGGYASFKFNLLLHPNGLKESIERVRCLKTKTLSANYAKSKI